MGYSGVGFAVAFINSLLTLYCEPHPRSASGDSLLTVIPDVLPNFAKLSVATRMRKVEACAVEVARDYMQCI